MSVAPKLVKKLPGVLAFQRRHVVTDALMYSEIKGDFETYPLPVIRHGIRGTQNVNEGKSDAATASAAKGGEREISNIQITDSAKLDPNADALIVNFSLRLLDISDGLDACVAADKVDGQILRESLTSFMTRAKSSEGLMEVARRYTRNIANGRWLFRNRTIASSIEISIAHKEKLLARFDALALPTNRFGDYSDDESRVAEVLAQGLRGESTHGVTVTARITFGFKGSIEVFPSQNYIENKPKGFARSLFRIGKPERIHRDEPVEFRVMGQAALRDQKIFNAIRTIDTWYPAFPETGFPIAVEPAGASLSQQEFYRPKESSSFAMFKRLNTIDPNSPDGMFCIAALDRGGVYSDSDKAVKEEKKKRASSSADDGAVDDETSLE
ncbi:CRISPR-associated protein Csy3 [Gammaproteobacteria bacterium]